MLIRCGLMLLFLGCVKTTENIEDDVSVSDYNRRFALWPSVHNAARLMRKRREDTKISPDGKSEGEHLETVASSSTTTQAPQQPKNSNQANNGILKDQAINQGSKSNGNSSTPSLSNSQIPGDAISKAADANSGAITSESGSNFTKSGPGEDKSGLNPVKSILNDTKLGLNETKSVDSEAKPVASNATVLPSNPLITNTASPAVNVTNNSTITVKTGKPIGLNDPGVVKRGLIVFGGFALLAVAYYIFYRGKGKNNFSGNSHSLIDTNQFRYGVVQSEDKRDTELSRVPLTMESDEDEEEDLEIFDLGQKKKSLSYVNLQTNDEDVVFSLNDQEEDLLLDIEDGTSNTLINWSSDGNNKSIL